MPKKYKDVGKIFNSMMKKGPSGKVMNKPNGIKQIGDMIKNAARNPSDYYTKNAPNTPIKKGRTSGPAERIGRKYGTKAGRAIDKGINAVEGVGRSARNVANRAKGMAMDIHGEAKQKKFSGYDMLKAGGAGIAGYGIGQAIGSKWSEHKRSQRGY